MTKYLTLILLCCGVARADTVIDLTVLQENKHLAEAQKREYVNQSYTDIELALRQSTQTWSIKPLVITSTGGVIGLDEFVRSGKLCAWLGLHNYYEYYERPDKSKGYWVKMPYCVYCHKRSRP